MLSILEPISWKVLQLLKMNSLEHTGNRPLVTSLGNLLVQLSFGTSKQMRRHILAQFWKATSNAHLQQTWNLFRVGHFLYWHQQPFEGRPCSEEKYTKSPHILCPAIWYLNRKFLVVTVLKTFTHTNKEGISSIIWFLSAVAGVDMSSVLPNSSLFLREFAL